MASNLPQYYIFFVVVAHGGLHRSWGANHIDNECEGLVVHGVFYRLIGHLLHTPMSTEATHVGKSCLRLAQLTDRTVFCAAAALIIHRVGVPLDCTLRPVHIMPAAV